VLIAFCLVLASRSLNLFALHVLAAALFGAGIAQAQTKLPDAPTAAQSPVATHPEQAQSSSEYEQAEQQVHEEEHQRILGVVPNFYTSFYANNVVLSPGQKFRLAFANALDPVMFLAAGLDAGYEQATDQFEGYGQGMQGYGKRVGASYADTFDGILLGSAVFPVLLREDPRYFRKGTGSIGGRTFYAISTEFITKNDNGTWGPNYANVAGNLAAGGLSNLYYPKQDRGVGLTFERAAFDTIEGAMGAIVVEFWPDIVHHFSHKKQEQPAAAPDAHQHTH
jgi:hypothetical protein